MSSTQGVPKDWMNTTYWLEFDPKVKGRVWSVNSWTHDLPRPKMWRTQSIRNIAEAFAAATTAEKPG